MSEICLAAPSEQNTSISSILILHNTLFLTNRETHHGREEEKSSEEKEAAPPRSVTPNASLLHHQTVDNSEVISQDNEMPCKVMNELARKLGMGEKNPKWNDNGVVARTLGKANKEGRRLEKEAIVLR